VVIVTAIWTEEVSLNLARVWGFEGFIHCSAVTGNLCNSNCYCVHLSVTIAKKKYFIKLRKINK
jgi:hypothetical protein